MAREEAPCRWANLTTCGPSGGGWESRLRCNFAEWELHSYTMKSTRSTPLASRSHPSPYNSSYRDRTRTISPGSLPHSLYSP